MTLPALAELSDLTVRLELPADQVDTERALALLADASSMVRAYCGREFVDDDNEADAPDAVRAVVCQVAGRAYGTASEAAGIQQESLGSYSFSTGAAAAAGPLGLLADERAVLDRYRHVARSVQVGSWL